ncbi:tetratricopeptide repeat protein [Croceimicrobium sp.]|uniref:tetratricopeptide repeat protein n=1 Tax=Croceimicrobium sp. TaxID=2828340 RepID=UPI003BAC9B98
MKIPYLLVFIFLIQSPGLWAQEGQESLKPIEEALASYQYQKAFSLLNALPVEDQKSEAYYALASSTYRALGYSNEARSIYQAWTDLDSTSLEAWLQWAQMENQVQEYDEAFRIYSKLLSLDSTNAYFHKLMGQLQLKRENPVGALGSFIDAAQLNPKDSWIQAQLINLYLEFQFYAQADSLLELNLQSEPDSKLLRQLALRSAFIQKQYPEVLMESAALFQLDADSTYSLMRMQGIAAYHNGNYALADSSLQRAVQLTQDPETLYFYLALSKFAQDANAAGEAYLRAAIKAGISKAIPVYELNLALYLDEEKRYTEAIPLYKSVYEANESPLMLYYLARAYDEQYKSKTTALSYYEQFLEKGQEEPFQYLAYSRERISEIKKVQHFQAE